MALQKGSVAANPLEAAGAGVLGSSTVSMFTHPTETEEERIT